MDSGRIRDTCRGASQLHGLQVHAFFPAEEERASVDIQRARRHGKSAVWHHRWKQFVGRVVAHLQKDPCSEEHTRAEMERTVLHGSSGGV
ncbi:unnamed protein product [Heligmosomoides polygyrus]|uniref:Transposase n=1 Tax=Heligmosomoides polygyrus TaxID=6339 RepID=A0A183GWV1_HELPZ|nr:unnamed protein product [Heligmosomoides polygyrus]